MVGADGPSSGGFGSNGDWPYPPCLQAPPGWVIHHRELIHSEFGGSTDGSHSLALLCPGSRAVLSDATPSLPQQPWIPLLATIKSGSNAPSCAAPPAGDFSQPRVYKEGDVFLPFGLFPFACLGARVRVPGVFNKPTLSHRWLHWLTCLSSCRSGYVRPEWRPYC